MKTYNIPIIYQRVETINVEANNLQEAVEIALKQFLAIPDDNYLDDSFEVDTIVDDYEEHYSVEVAIDKL